MPLQLGETARYITKQDILVSALAAREKFFDRQKPIEIYDADWQGKSFTNTEWEDEEDEVNKLLEKDAHQLAASIEAEIFSTTFVEEKAGKKKISLDGEDRDQFFGEEGSSFDGSTVVQEVPPRADGLWKWEVSAGRGSNVF